MAVRAEQRLDLLGVSGKDGVSASWIDQDLKRPDISASDRAMDLFLQENMSTIANFHKFKESSPTQAITKDDLFVLDLVTDADKSRIEKEASAEAHAAVPISNIGYYGAGGTLLGTGGGILYGSAMTAGVSNLVGEGIFIGSMCSGMAIGLAAGAAIGAAVGAGYYYHEKHQAINYYEEKQRLSSQIKIPQGRP
jgi:hypothetical protein